MSGVRNISDEVFPGIIVGGKAAARNKQYLSLLGVTHVLNTAEGCGYLSHGTVNLDKDYYKPVGIQYKGLKLVDIDQTNIREHVDDVVDFIDAALREGGKVLVNCNLGMSRSAACTCAYLIVRHKMTVNQAINQIRKHRVVKPNAGFIRQLSELDRTMRGDTNEKTI